MFAVGGLARKLDAVVEDRFSGEGKAGEVVVEGRGWSWRGGMVKTGVVTAGAGEGELEHGGQRWTADGISDESMVKLVAVAWWLW